MKLYVTYCSGKKHEGRLPPDKLYDSRRIDQFTQYCKANNLDWAIFSAKYGFFFPDEQRERYDTTLKSDKRCWLGINVVVDGERLPSKESEATLRELAQTVKAQADRLSVERVIFYTRNPMRAKCYLALLHYVLDNCDRPHAWRELLKCIEESSRIQVATQLA